LLATVPTNDSHLTIIDLNNSGVVLGKLNALDDEAVLWSPDNGYVESPPKDAPWTYCCTIAQDINDAGDVLALASGSIPGIGGISYGILHTHNTSDESTWTWEQDITGALRASLGTHRHAIEQHYRAVY
jgi:hypothetical protein